jgi:hypothetical protein
MHKIRGININVCIVKYCDMFRCIYIIFSQSFLIYAKVKKSLQFIELKCLHRLLLQIINRLQSLKTSSNIIELLQISIHNVVMLVAVDTIDKI